MLSPIDTVARNRIMYKNNDIQAVEKSVLLLDQYADDLPKILDPILTGTIELNPDLQRISNIIAENSASNATSATIYTTNNNPSTQQFYLTSVTLSMIKDATSTSVESDVNITMGGVVYSILTIPSLTLTAQNQSIFQSFKQPLPIDANTAITVTNSTNNANIKANGTITGYYANTGIYQTIDNN